MESSHSSMEVLPVPCLCEFLLGWYQDQLVGGSGAAAEGDADPNSHRSHYKRRRTNKDKVGDTGVSNIFVSLFVVYLLGVGP